MKAYKLTVLIVDHDELGEDGIRSTLENANYPNDCLMPDVRAAEVREIGEWHDDHPLNIDRDAEYARLFPAGEVGP